MSRCQRPYTPTAPGEDTTFVSATRPHEEGRANDPSGGTTAGDRWLHNKTTSTSKAIGDGRERCVIPATSGSPLSPSEHEANGWGTRGGFGLS